MMPHAATPSSRPADYLAQVLAGRHLTVAIAEKSTNGALATAIAASGRGRDVLRSATNLDFHTIDEMPCDGVVDAVGEAGAIALAEHARVSGNADVGLALLGASSSSGMGWAAVATRRHSLAREVGLLSAVADALKLGLDAVSSTPSVRSRRLDWPTTSNG